MPDDQTTMTGVSALATIRREMETLRAERNEARAERDALKAELERLRAVLAGDVLGQIDEVEAKRAAMPDDERQRVEAADAPLLRLQLAGWYKQAKEAEKHAAYLDEDVIPPYRAAIERVRALHSAARAGDTCYACGDDEWLDGQCPTIRALDNPTDTTGDTEPPARRLTEQQGGIPNDAITPDDPYQRGI